MTQREYFTEYQQEEEDRLLAQGTLLDPLTRRLFAAAGLTGGMRVLDLGCGVGNVARLAAEFVGDDGAVVAVDRDPEAVRRAARLTAGVRNVEFRVADIEALAGIDGEFDAVVGRAVLMYLGDPPGAVRQAAALLRPGGLVCMHEPDFTQDWSNVDTPTWRQVRAWIMAAITRIDAHARMGPSLFATLRDAGLPDPELTMETVVGGGARSPAFGWANIVRAILPLIEGLGIATAAEVDVDTLTERLDTEIDAEQGIVLGPPMYGAWTTV